MEGEGMGTYWVSVEEAVVHRACLCLGARDASETVINGEGSLLRWEDADVVSWEARVVEEEGAGVWVSILSFPIKNTCGHALPLIMPMSRSWGSSTYLRHGNSTALGSRQKGAIASRVSDCDRVKCGNARRMEAHTTRERYQISSKRRVSCLCLEK